MIITFQNFHDRTRAAFTACQAPDRAPDFVSDSGSKYWDCGESVVRSADHWSAEECGDLRSCNWSRSEDPEYFGKDRAGFCQYADFHQRVGRMGKAIGQPKFTRHLEEIDPETKEFLSSRFPRMDEVQKALLAEGTLNIFHYGK